MQETEVWQILKDLIEGGLTPAGWLAWWDQHDAEVKALISPGEYLRLKPQTRAQGDDVVAGRCQKEACAILRKRQIPFVDQTSGRFAQAHADFMERMRFCGRVLGIAEELHRAQVPVKVSEPWYREFLKSGNRDEEAWIRQRVTPLFKCVTTRPVWVNEPEWPWEGDVPMVFVTQYSIPENDVTTEATIDGFTIYVFSRRIPEGDRFRVEFHIVKQLILGRN